MSGYTTYAHVPPRGWYERKNRPLDAGDSPCYSTGNTIVMVRCGRRRESRTTLTRNPWIAWTLRRLSEDEVRVRYGEPGEGFEP